MEKTLNKQEIHNLCMNHVGKELEAKGYQFLAINSQLNKNPQFVCQNTAGEIYFILIKSYLLPTNPRLYDLAWMEKMKSHAFQKNAKIIFAGIAIGNHEDLNLPIYLNKPYKMDYTGLIHIDTQLN